MTDPGRKPEDRQGYLQKRRDKVREEIERNRRGEYRVPTWVLVALLVLVVGGFVAILVFY